MLIDGIFYPDADLTQADWTKQTWDVDLPQTAGDVDALTDEALRELAALPVWAAAPGEVRAAGEERLAAIDDDLG